MIIRAAPQSNANAAHTIVMTLEPPVAGTCVSVFCMELESVVELVFAAVLELVAWEVVSDEEPEF